MEDHILINYLKNQLEPKEKTEIEKWINASPDNKSYFTDLQQLWLQAGNIPELSSPDIDAAWKRFDQATTKRSILNLQTLLKVAASFAIIIGCYFFFKLQLPFWKAEKYISVISGDSIKELVLSDSTFIWLNKHSKIEYSNGYNATNRKLKLEGEAFFEVRHNNKIPFEITTQQASIKDIGTAFNVISDRLTKSVKIAVVIGKVSLNYTNELNNETMLVSNQVATMLDNKSIKIKNVRSINDNAWLTRKFEFQNQTLYDIAYVVGKTYNYKIYFSGKGLTNTHITASFDHQTITDIINVLAETANLNYNISGNRVVFFK